MAPRTSVPSHPPAAHSLGLETLSAREVPAVVATWTSATGELSRRPGQTRAERIVIQESAGRVSVPGTVDPRPDRRPDGRESGRAASRVVSRITIDSRAGTTPLTFARPVPVAARMRGRHPPADTRHHPGRGGK